MSIEKINSCTSMDKVFYHAELSCFLQDVVRFRQQVYRFKSLYGEKISLGDCLDNAAIAAMNLEKEISFCHSRFYKSISGDFVDNQKVTK